MKVRLGHVTNSSSSSFIIAKNNKCTEEEIRNKLYTLKNEIKETLYDYCVSDDDYNVNEFINEMTSILYSTPSDLQLGEWIVSAAECCNENDEFDGFIYMHGNDLSTENFKVEACW